MMRRRPLLAALALLPATPARAHHSTAMFDMARTVTLAGTVKELQWTNPHTWLQVLVPDGKGRMVEWGLEMGAPFAMLRHGWNPSVVMPGDKVTVRLAPLRNGEPGGQLQQLTLPDGSILHA